MSEKLGVVSVSTGAAVAESSETVAGGMVEGLESKTLMEDSSRKGVLSDGVRVSEESKVLVVESERESIISRNGRKLVKSGGLGISDKHDASRKRVVETTPRNRGWESWGVMNLVGRVLNGSFSMDDEEMEDVNNSENLRGGNPVADRDTWQDVIGEPAFENRIDVKSTSIEKDSDKLGSSGRGEGTGSNGNQDLVSNEMVPDGKMEIDVKSTGIDKDSDKLDSSGRGEGTGSNGNQDLVSNETVPDGKMEIDVKSKGIDKDSDKLDSSGRGEGTGSNGNQDLVSNDPVPDGKMEIDEVNDINSDALIPVGRGEHYMMEKEGEYNVSDLVWGKVRSHPWWPGQIFSPSDASDKASKYFKKECHLIAYFGDQTFAWNDGSKIKPFGKHFSQMEKQSNADGFSHAVSCALDEVGRRVELGLSCPCLPQEVHDKIKFQVVENAGIREESSKIEKGYNLSSAVPFLPGELVQFMESFAECPQSQPDRFQFAVMKAELLAFNRWKGHYQLPVFEECGGLMEDDINFTVKGEGKESMEVMDSEGANDLPSKKRKSTARDGSSQKHKHLTGEEEGPKTKEKSLSVLMSSSSSSLSIPSNSKVKRRKNLLSTRWSTGGTSASEGTGNSQRVEMVPAEIPTPDVILLKLAMAAKNPMQGHDSMIPVVDFLCELRKLTCLEKSGSGNAKIDAGKHKGKQPIDLESTDALGLEGTEDSYWTDRVIQSYSQDKVLLEHEKLFKRAAQLEGNKERDPENPPVPMNKDPEEDRPTAFSLKFTNLESIPSIENLNEIFRPYGPLLESETKVLSKSKCAKVIFMRRADAEVAFSSTGKYSIFGPSLKCYRLHYDPKTRKSRAKSKRKKKEGTSKK